MANVLQSVTVFILNKEKKKMSFGIIILVALAAVLFILGPILVAVGAAAWINDRFLSRK